MTQNCWVKVYPLLVGRATRLSKLVVGDPGGGLQARREHQKPQCAVAKLHLLLAGGHGKARLLPPLLPLNGGVHVPPGRLSPQRGDVLRTSAQASVLQPPSTCG